MSDVVPVEVQSGSGKSNVGNRFRNYCFTLHLHDGATAEHLLEAARFLGTQSDRVRYLVGQNEECPETKRIHFQGYVQFKHPTTVKSIKKLLERHDPDFGRTIHLSRANGSAEANFAYCTKDESRYVPDGTDPVDSRVEHGERDEGAGQGAGE